MRWRVKVRMDLGSEFCGPPPKKQRQWREALGVLGGRDRTFKEGDGAASGCHREGPSLRR